jgi:galactitol-specific phosphotransferase system IIC component
VLSRSCRCYRVAFRVLRRFPVEKDSHDLLRGGGISASIDFSLFFVCVVFYKTVNKIPGLCRVRVSANKAQEGLNIIKSNESIYSEIYCVIRD